MADAPQTKHISFLGNIRALIHRPSFFVHLHPPMVRLRTFKFSTTWGLGITAIFLGVILLFTGALLMVFYVPSPDMAHASIQDLEALVPFGGVVRSLHRVAANVMVGIVWLHLFRVILRGADAPPRTVNAWVGILLLGITMSLAFTGYLLPWDQRAYWACTVGADLGGAAPWIGRGLRRILLGGDEVGAAALLRFYALHCIVLPTIGALLTGYHVWRIRKDGGLALPRGNGG